MNLYDTMLVSGNVLTVVIGFCAFFIISKYRLAPRNVYLFLVAWAAVYLFEYYFLGPNSYIHMDEEGDHFPSYYTYLLTSHLGGQFGHHVGGGIDVFSSFSPNVQMFSPELVLLSVFPFWIGFLVHMVIMVGIGLWGAYLLCLKTSECQPGTAAAVAALFTVSSYIFPLASYPIGAGIAFLPMAIYVMVVRSQERHYFRYVVPLALFSTAYMNPPLVVEAMFAGLGLSAIMLNRINVRVVMSLVILLVFELINWSEPLYALMVMSPYSERGGNIEDQTLTLARLSDTVGYVYGRIVEYRANFIAFGALAVLWLKRDSLRLPGTLVVFGLFVLLGVLILFPWQVIGLAPINNLSHHYVMLAMTGLFIPLMGRAATVLKIPGRIGTRLGKNAGTAVVLALAIGLLGYFKFYNFANLLYHGGQSQYRSIDTLADTSWRPAEPFRVITLRVRDLGPEPAIPYGFYGLESFDVFLNLRPSSWSKFYNIGILGKPHTGKVADPRLFVEWSRWRDGRYHGIGEQVSLPLLRLANVGFILSPLPFPEGSLRLVAGPPEAPITRYQRKTRPFDYFADRIKRLFDFTDLYVYALPDPYPQVFAPDRVEPVEDGTSLDRFISIIKREAQKPDRVAVIRKAALESLGRARTSLKIEKFERVQDGFRIRIQAPEGGVVVVNTVALPFWTAATNNGRQLKIIPVNQIQMGVQAPPGSREIIFRYHRPTVAEALRGLFF